MREAGSEKPWGIQGTQTLHLIFLYLLADVLHFDSLQSNFILLFTYGKKMTDSFSVPITKK